MVVAATPQARSRVPFWWGHLTADLQIPSRGIGMSTSSSVATELHSPAEASLTPASAQTLAPGAPPSHSQDLFACFRRTDEEPVFQEQLQDVIAERDHLRRELESSHRLCESLKAQLCEERGMSAHKPGSSDGSHLAETALTSVTRPDSWEKPAAQLQPEVELADFSNDDRARVMRRLFESLEVIASDLYMSEVVDRVSDITTRMLCCERVTVFIADASKHVLRVLRSEDDLSEVTVEYGVGLVGYAGQHGVAINVADAYDDARFNKAVDQETGFRTKAVLCCPTFDSSGQLIAVIQVRYT